MKIHYTQTISATANVSRIRMTLPVDEYDIEDGLRGCPGLSEDERSLTLAIDLDTFRVVDWPESAGPMLIHIKARDKGVYELVDPDGKVIATRDDDYVPPCVPGDYGDYVIFGVKPDGSIHNENGERWPGPRPHAVAHAFFGTEAE